jgi:hypothetical protein
VVPEEYDQYYKFIVKRCPYERFVSYWRWSADRYASWGNIADRSIGQLKNWLDLRRNRPRFQDKRGVMYKTQWDYHKDNDIDKILDIKTLAADLATVPCVDARLSSGQLPDLKKRNASSHDAWQTYYDQDLLDFVNDYYADDFTNLGFTQYNTVEDLPPVE